MALSKQIDLNVTTCLDEDERVMTGNVEKVTPLSDLPPEGYQPTHHTLEVCPTLLS
jgi:hypothetical protein